MPLELPPSSDLANFLKRKDPALYGKVAEVRAEVRQWLTYVPATFSHYTSHTIDHSDEIVDQMSKLLFPDGKKKPVVAIGPVAAYILIAGAYLHDAGMVASEQEKETILRSEEWQKWTTEGSGAPRWKEIQVATHDAGSDQVKLFAVARMLRILIAEFIRRQHPQRAGDLVRARALELGRLDFGNQFLRNAIAKICVGHGLDHPALEDDVDFPEASDIQGERVNLRLLATLLRLGDLLDMRTNRACSLLLQAACPLPADSIAHWTQYQRVTKRLTTPERIEIRAECENHDEHRVLVDWCTWIAREVERIPRRLPRTKWEPPHASLDGKDPTIHIVPAKGATYIPERWSFELDADAVFQRLIADVYESPNVFLRELIQNALDATRCRMYEDMKAQGLPLPDYPDLAPEDILERYPVHISLREEKVRNDASGQDEVVQVLTIDDQGLGMDKEIIQRYLLQVGRSYYTTADFRRAFQFHSCSRFGVGFLSVFAVSDHVTIETYKRSSAHNDDPLRLKLTGPRSYILLEKGTRSTPGTRIEVRLRKPLEKPLEDLVRDWCVFVEFPIEIDDQNKKSTVRRLRFEDMACEWSDPREPNVRFGRRVYPVKLSGAQGAFIADMRIDGAIETLLSSDENRRKPVENQRTIITHHGMRNQQTIGVGHLAIVADWRKGRSIPLSREFGGQLNDPEVVQQLEEWVNVYLGVDNGPMDYDRWLRLRDLLHDQRLAGLPMWMTRPDVMPVWIHGTLHFRAPIILTELAKSFFQVHQTNTFTRKRIPESDLSNALPHESLLIHRFFRISANNSPWQRLRPSFRIVDVRSVNGYLLAECAPISAKVSPDRNDPNIGFWDTVDRPEIRLDIMVFDTTPFWGAINIGHPFGLWCWNMLKMQRAGDNIRNGLWRKIESLLREGIRLRSLNSLHDDLMSLLHAWNAQPGLPDKLRWPGILPRYWEPPPESPAPPPATGQPRKKRWSHRPLYSAIAI